MSLSLTRAPFSVYSDSPDLNSRRPITTSSNSVGSQSDALSKVSKTSAMLCRERTSDPAKITSSALRIRRLVGACSPSAHRIASDRLLLPDPLGPTIAVIPGGSSTAVRRGNVLKPCSSIRLRCSRLSLQLWQGCQCSPGCRLLGPLFTRTFARCKHCIASNDRNSECLRMIRTLF